MNTDQLNNFNIAIIGGGYAGVTAALALNQIGANVTVYEQAKSIGEVGAGIGLRPASIKLFRKLGVFDDIAAVTSPSKAFDIVDAKGNPITTEEWPQKDGDENTTRMIHRRDFIDALVKNLPEGMLMLDHKLVDLKDNGDSATLAFANGEVVTADVVVGADGIRSRVRQLFGNYEPVPAFAHAYRVVLDGAEAEGLLTDDNLRLYLDHETGNMIYFLPLRHRGPHGQVSFDITVVSEDTSWAPQVSREEILHAVRNFDERLIRMVENMDMDKVNFRSAYDIDPVETWNTDSIVLIGDAAHAMLHHQGQGANSAVIDGGALADAFLNADSVPAAFEAFVAERKEATQTLQRISRESWNQESASSTAFPEKEEISY